MATEGADVFDLGVLPTPGVATVAARRRLPGAVVSASHNPFGDNGIKLFSSLGTKLPVALESDVEREIASILGDSERPPRRPTGYGVGRIIVDTGAADLYRDELVAGLDGRTLEGLHIVVDCANGAASAIAPEVLAALGATVTSLNDTPDGANINEKCGSTHPEELARTVAASGGRPGSGLRRRRRPCHRGRSHRAGGGR